MDSPSPWQPSTGALAGEAKEERAFAAAQAGERERERENEKKPITVSVSLVLSVFKGEKDKKEQSRWRDAEG